MPDKNYIILTVNPGEKKEKQAVKQEKKGQHIREDAGIILLKGRRV